MYLLILGPVTLSITLFIFLSSWFETTRRRLLACSALWVSTSAILFWDYLPAKAYFQGVCKDAGAHVLTHNRYADVFAEVRRDRRSDGATKLDWHVEKFETFYLDVNSGDRVAVVRGYRLTDGAQRWLKPWQFGECFPDYRALAFATNPDPAVKADETDGRLSRIPLTIKQQLEEGAPTK